MKATYSQSEIQGHGALIFSDDIFPDGPWSIAIERGSDRQFLTANADHPWTGEATFLNIAGEPQKDGSIRFEIGPEIVDRLDQQEAYRLRLKGPDGEPLTARLSIDSIAHSPAESLKNTARPAEAKPKPPKPEEPKAPEPKAPEPKAPEPQKPKEPEKKPGPERLDLAAEPAKPGHKYWRMGILLLLIALCLAWYLFDPRWKDSGHEENAQAQKTPLSAEEQVRQFFRKPDPSAKDAMALADSLPKDTQADQDAVFRLYYYAAEKNVPGAALAYGACLDPSKPAWGTVEKDGAAAWDAYKRAPNQDKAAAAMTDMRSWLEDEAQRGNARATKWLREIER